MLAIGPLQHSDLPAALELSTQAGWNQIAEDWLRLIDLKPDGCLAGRFEGRLVATATLACYTPSPAWVGMILVDQNCRGQGFGGQIMDAILHRAKELNIDSLGLDATDAGRPIYAKRGFVDIIGIDRRVLPAAAQSTFDGVAERVCDDDWPSLINLDRQSLGIDRSRLLKRLSEHSECRVIRRGGRVRGFGFRRKGRLADQIGPVVAESAEDAADLFGSLVNGSIAEPRRELLLDSFRGGGLDAWLDSKQFGVSRKLTRMISGSQQLATMTGPSIFVAAGLELG